MLKIMMDSGAYSAWKSGSVIDLRSYIEFIADLNCVESVVNLDVIPGAFGSPPTAKQVEESAQKSWENYEALQYYGVESVPVFHQGEEWQWLERMIDAGVPYIGISPANDKLVPQRLVWLDEVFTRITNEDGWPVVKTHGFGMTSIALMNRYPWYSCDSISWLITGSYGHLMVPKHNPNGWDYGLAAQVIAVSDRHQHKLVANSHYAQLAEEAQAYVREYVEEEVGIPFDSVQKIYAARTTCNLHFFLNYAKQRVGKPFEHVTSSPFFTDRRHSKKGIVIDKMRLIMAENFCRVYSSILFKAGVNDRLLSYAGLRTTTKKDLMEYLETDGRIFKGGDLDGYSIGS